MARAIDIYSTRSQSALFDAGATSSVSKKCGATWKAASALCLPRPAQKCAVKNAQRMTALSIGIMVLRAAFHCLFSIGPSCRFTPTCGHYARLSLLEFGVLRGSYLSLLRIFRCHPWNTNVGYDPLPKPRVRDGF